MDMVYIYVLKLRCNKYYVGKTDNPNFRLNNHFDSTGSEWTKKYKPISVHELRTDCNSSDETTITKEYMKNYGIDNVRGGPWCQIDISKHKNSIKHMIDSESDNCYKCGKSGHFVNQCPQKVKNIKPIKKKCERCGRLGHTYEDCFASSHRNGYELSSSDEEFYSSDDEEFYSSDDEEFYSSSDEVVCYKCGRRGHYANTCYAKKNINGIWLR